MSLPPARIMATQDEQARQRRLSGEPLPPPAHGSAELKRIVLKACAYAPKDRYHAAVEMLADLKGLEDERASNADSIGEKYTTAEINNEYRLDDAVAESQNTASEQTRAAVGTLDQTENDTADRSGKNTKKPPKTQSQKNTNRVKRKSVYGVCLIAVTVALICTVCGIYGYTHCWFGHTWEGATCTNPATCTRCGKINGKALGHNWPTMEELSYCLRCNYPNGKLKQMDVGDWHSEWTNETVKFGLGNGKTVDCTPFKPSTKIEKCYSLTLHLEIKQYSYGNIEGEWGFYIHDLNGEWHLADSFILSGNQAEVHFEFDKPISFDLWACPCHCLGSDWSFSYAAWLHNIRVFELAK